MTLISNEKIEELLGAFRQTLEGMSRLQEENNTLHKENNDLNKEMISMLKAQVEDEKATAQTAPNPKQEDDEKTGRGFPASRKPSNRPRPTRPSIEAEMNDVEWGIFLDKWQHYKSIAELSTDEEMCLELRESCSSQVHKLLYEYVGTKELNRDRITEDTMLNHIKSVAVKSINKEVYRWRYSQLKQEDGEPITKYVGRLKSQAVLCEYKVKCQCCETDVSYANEMVSQQLITGLANPEHQSRVMSEAQDLAELQNKIDRLVSLETTDSATANIRSMPSQSSAVRFSKYKQAQRAKIFDRSPRDQRRGRAPARRDMSPAGRRDVSPAGRRDMSRRCRGCGRSSHPDGKGLTREECPAFGKTCNICGIKNHFSKVCRRRSRSNFAGTDDDEYTASGSETEVSECNYSGRDEEYDTDFENECTESRHFAARTQGFRRRPREKLRI